MLIDSLLNMEVKSGNPMHSACPLQSNNETVIGGNFIQSYCLSRGSSKRNSFTVQSSILHGFYKLYVAVIAAKFQWLYIYWCGFMCTSLVTRWPFQIKHVICTSLVNLNWKLPYRMKYCFKIEFYINFQSGQVESGGKIN